MNASVPITEEPKTRRTLPRTRRGCALRNALPLFVKSVARGCGAEVLYGNWRPHRIGKKIFLPDLPFDDPETEVLAFGYTWHELCHLLADETGGSCVTTSELQAGLRRLLQDPVDERVGCQKFRGAKYRLHRMVERMVERGDFAQPTAADPPLVQLQKYLLYRLRSIMLGQNPVDEYARQAEALVRDTFPAGACVRFGSVIGRVPALRTRQEVADLAQEIVEIIREESEEPPNDSKTDGQDEPDDGEGNSPDGNAGSPPSSDDSTTQSQGPTDGDDGTPGDSTSDGVHDDNGAEVVKRANLRSILDADAGDFGPDLGEVLGDALKKEATEALTKGMGGGVGLASAPLEKPKVDTAAVLAEVAHATIALRTRLSALVEASRQAHAGYTRHGTRPDPRRFVSALCGDPNIYRARREERDVNTRVLWLIDTSSSMAVDDRIQIARQSVLAAAGTLESIPGISQAVASFPGDQSQVVRLADFGQSVKKRAGYIHGLQPSGGTPALAALLWGVDQLLDGLEPRKLLIMVTDGEPPLNEVEPFKEIVRRCWESGIEACGIGIRVPDISDLFPMSRSVHKLEELAPAMFGLLQELLTRRTSL